MKRHKRIANRFSVHRAEIDADDGQDPRTFFIKETFAPRTGRKAQQLAAQVARTLEQLFAESADPVLQSQHVAEVVPAPDATRLLVLVALPARLEHFSEHETASALARASGWLRSEVAAAITRKRAPLLVFQILPAPPATAAEPVNDDKETLG